MSGKIEFITRKGISKDPKYDFYEYWAWKITGEDGTIVQLTPKYSELMEVFKKIFAHEKRIDRERVRKPDATKWAEFITSILKEAKNNKLITDFK
jgi:hypothetical protein